MRYDDLAERMATKMIEMIEGAQQLGDWSIPWEILGTDILSPINAHTRNHYRGTNVFSLAFDALMSDYPHGVWATYRQWQLLGAQVRKGEKAHAHVVKWVAKKKVLDETDDPEAPKEGRLFPKVYAVFNVDQVDGYELPELEELDDLDEIAAFVSLVPATITHGGDRAFFEPLADLVRVPEQGQFADIEGYYATVLHELVHWTGHRSRLNRETLLNYSQSVEMRASEELVAELGSAILCARLGISPTPRESHAQYLAHWAAAISADPKILLQTARTAQASVDYLLSFDPAYDSDAAGEAGAGDSTGGDQPVEVVDDGAATQPQLIS